MKSLLLLTLFSSVLVDAKTDTFSADRFKEFYEELICDEKQELAAVNLTEPCVAFWVSPSGSDSASGTQEAPFRTLERARDAVRAVSSAVFKEQDVTIFIEEGTYRLERPLVLSATDSGREGHDVVYAAVSGAHPVISGAVKVTGWSPYLTIPGVYKASVDHYRSRQLYVNGTRAVRAQTAANPIGFLPKWTNGGIEFNPVGLNPATWTNVQEIEAVVETQWKMMRVPLASITPYSFPTNGLITLQQPAWNNANIYLDVTTGLPGEWSFFEVTRFENALEFLTQPGQWYLDTAGGLLYYYPLPGEEITTADVELPLLETLIVGQGTLDQPIHNIRFEGLTFSYATWLAPSGSNGYVSDQSAQLVIGNNPTNVTGHNQRVVPTPGNLSFDYAHHIVFSGNIFEHLGAVGLQFGPGSSNNTVDSNLFTDISSSAIEVGAVTARDAHPHNPGFILTNHLVTNNLIRSVAREYIDAAGIFVGFTKYTTIKNNTIVDVPWSGIAMGWGWGLLDVGSFPGIANAVSGEWGTFHTPTPNQGCKILQNKIVNFLNILWDGGAIYTTGQQGPNASNGLLIEGNVAYGKRVAGGGNTYYTDGGSRYIHLRSNVSYNNPIGITYYGPGPQIGDPFFLQYPPYYLQNGFPYGSDSGGCRTYGDILFTNNYWLETPIPANLITYNNLYHSLLGFYAYIGEGYTNVCPFTLNGITYPINITYQSNHQIASRASIPKQLLSEAGVQQKPPTIPQNRWVLPPP